MLTKVKEAIGSFLRTKTGHALEHAVTAAAATALGLLAAKALKGQPITVADARDALALFISGALFGIRTVLRNL